MSKTGYKELAQALVDKYGLERAAAEQFVEKMFGVLVKGIADDRLVKVKGLGTFKVIGVASRKSVDVNTGDPIIIEGRDKVTFIPDNAMRDLVNRPFSQFETVAVNEGVDFTAIDERFAAGDIPVEELLADDTDAVDADTDASDAEADSSVTDEPETPTEPETPAEPEVPVVEPVVSTEPAAPTEPEVPMEPVVTTEPAEPVEPAAPMEPVVSAEPPTEDSSTDIPAADPTPEVHNPVAEAERQADDARNQLILLKQEMVRQHRLIRWFLGIAVVLLAVSVGGIFYLFAQLTQRDHRIEHLESQAILASRTPQGRAILDASVDTVAVARARQDSLAAARALKAEEQARRQAAEQQAQSHPAVQKPQPAADKPSAATPGQAARKPSAAAAPQPAQAKKPQPAQTKQPQQADKQADKEKTTAATYNKDVRIRTGAYDIVGIERTVTVKAGQTLEGISRTHLGPGMECYIEAVNGGSKQLKAGDKVNIPQLKLKKKK